MFAYYLRLALKSIRRNAVLSSLMVSAIGIGIGACMTVITVYYMMSSNPIPHKSEQLFAVQLNSWEAPGPYDLDDPDLLPEVITYRDAMNLLDSEVPDRATAMYESVFTLDPENPEINPMLAIGRFTTADFFFMFEAPFLYGGPWTLDAGGTPPEDAAVINFETNETVFGGENSVGRSISLDNREFTVVGVLDQWEPVPKYYTAFNDDFGQTDDVFLPIEVNESWQKQNFGNTNCWGDTPMNTFEDFLNSECVWVEYWVELSSVDQQASFEAWLAGYIAEQKQLGRFQIEGAEGRISDVMEWLEVNRVVSQDVRVLLGLAFMFLAVCLLNTVALLLAKFSGKAPRVGLRRALGASKASIFRQNLVEVGVIGLAGGALGLALAWLGLRGVNAVNMGRYDRMIDMDWQLVSFALVLSIIAAIFAGLYPTWRVCQVPPATYLKTQ